MRTIVRLHLVDCAAYVLSPRSSRRSRDPILEYYRSIARKAAALTHSLALNHGFVDGNKRTALYAVNLLLRKSGYILRHRSRPVANREVEAMIVAIVEHRMSFDELVIWFQERIVSVRQHAAAAVSRRDGGDSVRREPKRRSPTGGRPDRPRSSRRAPAGS